MSGAAAGAAAQKRRELEEEEEMTGYSAEDLAEGWEFKILRSTTGAFKGSDFLKHVLEEERRNGWTLVEKFDNSRIRLKRPVSARSTAAPGLDPYRSRVGIHPVVLALSIVASVFAIMGAVAAILIALRPAP